jgi:SAM-dependent methyltransferase
MNERINPKIWAGRYYHLIQLKKCNLYVIDKYIKGKISNLLDFGCGKSPYKPLISPHVNQYTGADIVKNEYAELLIDPETGKTETYPSQFDCILSTQVLEHVIDPKAYLRESARLLKKEGLLVLSTHGYWIHHPDPTDFWRWTRDGLEKIIKEEGFEIVETLGIFNRFTTGLQFMQDSLIYKLPKPIRMIWCTFFALAQWLFDNGKINNKDASVYMVVARKK